MSKNKYAYGMSDRSGFRYPLDELVEQYENRKPTGLLVGKDELDIDHEQLRLGDVDANDPQTLDNPRPELALAESRGLFSWNPVGAVGLGMSAKAGRIVVT